jgi:Lon protease-like protein
MSDEPNPLEGFNGTARLFPLPNLVLFPHVMQPLHIFEPRYRQMTVDALNDNRLIAMVLLQPGWEEEYNASPAIYSVGCLGRIVAEQRLPDGRYNILLRGLSRIQITQEQVHDKPYRQANVELLVDACSICPERERKLRRRLIRSGPLWVPAKGTVLEQFRKLLKSDLPLGVLCDIVSFALPLDTSVKQSLLEELDVEKRACMLLNQLELKNPTDAKVQVERQFPPDFSNN